MKLSLSSSFFDGGAVITGGCVDGDGASTCSPDGNGAISG